MEDGFLKALDEAFPALSITADTPERAIRFNAGQRDVISRLRDIARKQRDQSPLVPK